jgi:Fanconi anemia group M protein
MAAVHIIVDNRERNRALLDELQSCGSEIEFAQVPVGDYIVSNRVCIERKTWTDFNNSIMDLRLFDQMRRLKASFEKPILLLEENALDSGLQRNAIYGAIAKIYIEYGVMVLASNGPEDSARIISHIAKKEQENATRAPRLLGLKRAHTDQERQRLILESLPGVGGKIAVNLLEQFGSIRQIANLNAKELTKVEKIGRKKAERIYKVLNSEYATGKT